EDHLGGWSARWRTTFPVKPPYDAPVDNGIDELIGRVEKQERIDLRLNTRIERISGEPGRFDVTLQNGKAPEVVRVGSVVQATGWRPYDPENLGHLGYGLKNVVTNVQLEDMLASGAVARPSDGAAPKSIAFVQCAGSRDKDHLPYCSAVCCRVSLKQAMQLRALFPEAKIYVLYKDVRSPGQYELFYQKAQADPGFFFTKGEVAGVRQVDGDGVAVDLDDTLLGEPITVEADLLVLAAGMVPTTAVEDEVVDIEGGEEQPDAPVETGTGETADGKKMAAGAEKGAGILNLTYRQGTDLPTLKYGFPDSHFICFPYETRRTAIFAAGTVRAPMDIAQAAMDANGAALKAVQAIEMIAHGAALHPRSRDLSYPEFFLQRCTQCKRCTEDCPFGALDEDDKGTPEPNINRCRRCGTCMGACPERIINFQNYSVPMGNDMIKAIEVPEEDEEKPRIIAFMCENDALPALEMAAQKRMKLNPWVRIIPVRCLGSVNLVWITNCLDAGFDGIILLGCRHGEDYQCHFVRGSELAEYRMENIQEKLQQMALEEERVRVESVAIDEWERVVELLNGYAEEIEEIGPNPFKDF
ncbi:MAG TPA: hydrogenase iron-sulfur subunit, partial [Bacteroidetes bacterium]|nr:hydrogenase iron-sulfur subunit [Bacteroidota bacterium]